MLVLPLRLTITVLIFFNNAQPDDHWRLNYIKSDAAVAILHALAGFCGWIHYHHSCTVDGYSATLLIAQGNRRSQDRGVVGALMVFYCSAGLLLGAVANSIIV